MGKQDIFEQWESRAIEKFRKRTQKSARILEKARKYLPDGDTRTATFFKPYPLFMAKGEGCKFYDVDGNVYLDFLNNYTSLIHGHAYPPIIKAVNEQLKKGTSFAAPTESQSILAEMIYERVKSVGQVRFCNSGTEATMYAIRAARVISGRTKVVKMEGGYHGTHDLAEVSFHPNLDEAGSVDRPKSIPENRGIPKSVLEEVVVVPFNNKEVTEKVMRECENEIACVIVEPMLGAAGCICPQGGYLEFLRELTRKLNILLIFDEVVTFRLGPGGAQEMFGIEPDITTFGKIIGGGLPVGAFGGSKEIMKVFSPQEKGSISHSGTFNGNPVTMCAGIACLKGLTAEVYNHINSLGSFLKKGMDSAFEKSGIKGTATGIGSLTCIHFNPGEIRDYRSAARDNMQAMRLLHYALLEKGINVAPRGGECSISTPMTEKDVKTFLSALEESLAELKPFIEQTAPDLIK
jgi:glutamate-1-semialdehyde 2,1-aminomutase